jgi:hypothetical protein
MYPRRRAAAVAGSLEIEMDSRWSNVPGRNKESDSSGSGPFFCCILVDILLWNRPYGTTANDEQEAKILFQQCEWYNVEQKDRDRELSGEKSVSEWDQK